MVLRITVRPFGTGERPAGDFGNVEDPALAPVAQERVDQPIDTDPFAAVGDEVMLESSLVQTAQLRQVDVARAWLEQVAGRAKPAPAPPASADVVDTGEQGAVEAASSAAAARTVRGVKSVARASGETGPAVGRDLLRGGVEAPRQILGGMRDAVQSTMDFAHWLGGEMEGALHDVGLPMPTIGQPVTAALEAGAKFAASGAKLPEVKPAESVSGGLVRSVAQFLTGFAGAGKVMGPAKALGAAKPVLQGALADFAAFHAHEDRLSNLVQQFPALQNPITQFMAAKPDDNEAIGRLKRALEGAGLGMLTEGMIRAVRYVRDARRAAAAAEPAAAAPAREAQPLTLLGDEAGPLVQVGTKPAPRAPQSQGKAVPETGVPADVEARALTPKGLTPLTQGDNAVFVNFARINSTEDVKRVIADTAEAFSKDIEAARRGVRTNKTTLMASGKEDAWKVLSERRRGDPLNAEEAVAVRRLWEASGAKLLEVADAAARNPTAEALYEFRKMMAIHHEIQTQVIAARTETARALQSWAIPIGGRGGAERLRGIENVLATYGGEEAATALAKRVASLKNVPNGAAALDDMAERGLFARSVDAVKEFYINALLTSPQTHIVNTMGNSAGVFYQMIERAAAARLSQAAGSGQIQVGEAAAQAFASGRALREAFKLAWLALRTGESRFGAQHTQVADVGFAKAISAENLGVPQVRGVTKAPWWLARDGVILPENWLGKSVDAIGTAINTPVRLLNTADDFFKAIGYRMEVNALAFRQATREVQDGALPRDQLNKRIAELASDPPEHIKMAAVDAAVYQTFTSKPGAMVRAISQFERKLASREFLGAQIGALTMRLLIPFRNTPANLVSYAFERAPLAPLMSRWREDLAAGGARADMAVTRMALGTSVLMLMVDLANDGHITGGGPRGRENRPVKQAMERAGWQQYSVKLGDRYYSYRRTDPFGISLTMAADFAEVLANANVHDEDKQREVFEVAAAAALTFGNSMLERTYLSSVAELIVALDDPQERGPWFVQRRIAAFEPSVLGYARRNVDPYMRYSAGLVDVLRNRTPGLSEDLPLARDNWGRVRTYQSGLGVVYDAVSPIYSRLYNPEPIDKEILAQGWRIEMPKWTLNYGKDVNVSLRKLPEAYSRYLELRAQVKPSDMNLVKSSATRVESPTEFIERKYGDVAMLSLLNAIVSGDHPLSAAYTAASDGRHGGKEDMIKRIIQDYGRAARQVILQEFEVVQGVVTKKREARAAR